MVGRDDHQGVAVVLGPLEHLADGLVEVEEFLGHVAHLVAVRPVVDLGTFDHQEEAFLVVLAQQFDGLHRAVLQHGAAVQARVHVQRGEQGQELAVMDIREFLTLLHEVVAPRLHLLDEVPAVLALVPELAAAAEDEVHAAVHVLGGDLRLQVAVRAVAYEVGGRGVVDAARHDEAGLLAQGLRLMEQGEERFFVHILADVAVFGLLAGGKGGAAGAGIGDELVRAVSPGIAGHRAVVQVQVSSVEGPAHGHGLHRHAVADHEDDVLDLLGLGLLDHHGLVGGLDLILVVLAELVVRVLGQVPAGVHLRQCAGGPA